MSSSIPNYRARKLKNLLAYMQANDMQDLIDTNVWIHAAMCEPPDDSRDSDAYYAALPL